MHLFCIEFEENQHPNHLFNSACTFSGLGTLFKKILILKIMCMCVSVLGYLHVSVAAQGGQKRAVDLWVLGTELGSYAIVV